MAIETKERPEPIVLKNKNNDIYTLDFTRETCAAINKAGFNAEEIESNPEEMIPLLFFGAFRKNHRKVARNETDKILKEMGGMSAGMFERLCELYLQGREGLIVENEEFEENAKNTGWTVDF